MPVLARNKKAFHDYFIEDKLEAGIELALLLKNSTNQHVHIIWD